MSAQPLGRAEESVAPLLSELIRIDSTNGVAPERPAAEWVAGHLSDCGIDVQIVEPERGRASVLARVSGSDSDLAPLLVHAHLDTVPADPREWSVHPFSGEIADDYVWGRGAVDMKHMVAMLVALLRAWRASGQRPRRDLVLAFVADEEAGGHQGSRFLVRQHRELLEGCTTAIGEVGGFSITVEQAARLYLIQTAERGFHWLTLTAEGTGGHGSLIPRDNPSATLAAALHRIAEHRFPVRLHESMVAFVEAVSDLAGQPFDVERPDGLLSRLGPIRRMIEAALRSTAVPTWIEAPSPANVVPSSARAGVDARFLPGDEADVLKTVSELAGAGVTVASTLTAPAVQAPATGLAMETMTAALLAEDPEARVAPFLLSAGTDAKAFADLGIACYGFVPLLLPTDLDFAALFHGRDERVPVAGLQFGVRVLDRFLRSY